MSDTTRANALPLAYSDPHGGGTPVLLVHGFSHNRSVWEKLASALAPELRPIAVDLRGHGLSPWSPQGEYSLESHVDDLLALLDALEIERCAIVAHSLGGNVATLLAARAPDRVEALVLVDTGPKLEWQAIVHIADEFGGALRSYETPAQFRKQLSLTHPRGDAELLDGLAASSLVARLDGRFEPALDPGVLDDRVDPESVATLEAELWSALGRVRCPVLLVRGAISALLSDETARRMVDEVLADGRLLTLASAGHAVMIDDGPGLASAVAEFVPRARRSAS